MTGFAGFLKGADRPNKVGLPTLPRSKLVCYTAPQDCQDFG